MGCSLALGAPKPGTAFLFILPLFFFSSFQVPWFGSIPIAVSNDISERSVEDFVREVRLGLEKWRDKCDGHFPVTQPLLGGNRKEFPPGMCGWDGQMGTRRHSGAKQPLTFPVALVLARALKEKKNKTLLMVIVFSLTPGE